MRPLVALRSSPVIPVFTLSIAPLVHTSPIILLDKLVGSSVFYFVLLIWYWGIVKVPGFPRVNRPRIISLGGRIITLHLNYVAAVYTGTLLFLFERTHNYPVDNQGLLPWQLDRSKVCAASLVRVLSDGKISWVLWSQGLWNPVPPTAKQSSTCFFGKKKIRKKKTRRRDTRIVRIWELPNRDIDEFRLLWEYSQYWLPLPKAASGPAGRAQKRGVQGAIPRDWNETSRPFLKKMDFAGIDTRIQEWSNLFCFPICI